MSMSQMWREDRLDGASNWSPWKTRITFVLEDLELWDIVQAPVLELWDIVQAPLVIPPALAPSPLLDAYFRKDNIKVKRTICDVVRDHIIPHLTGKDHAFEMWASLCKLYQSPNQNWKMVLQEKLKSIQMLDFETVISYLSRFTQIRDELAAIREIVDPNSLLRTTLNNFSKPWGFICTRHRCLRGHAYLGETLGRFRTGGVEVQLWVFKTTTYTWGDEDLALWLKGKKNIGEGARQGPKGGTPPLESGSGNKKDISKVRCFACGEMGHYVGQCPKRKKKRRQGGMVATT
jgi:hypothetical protein